MTLPPPPGAPAPAPEPAPASEPAPEPGLVEADDAARAERVDGLTEADRDHRAARREQRRRQVARTRRRRVRTVLGAVLLVVIGVVAWYEVEAHPSGPTGPAVVVDVHPGEASGAVVSTLASRGVIGSSLAFRLYEELHGTPTIDPGRYLFHHHQSFTTVHQQLGAGPDVFDVTVPAGFTLAEVAERVGDAASGYPTPLSEASLLDAAKKGTVRSPYSPPGSTDLEGLVASGTYQVVPGETAAALLRQMVGRFDRQAAAAGVPAAAEALGLSRYQVVTMASIVTKEGYIAANMGKVARVIVNRLSRDMPLQMDSTVLYALGQDGGRVTHADEQLPTPYNSYRHTGLPPTPICTSGPSALRAAADPAPGQWLYFQLVSKDGTLAFADTYAEQLANEALAARRGLA